MLDDDPEFKDRDDDLVGASSAGESGIVFRRTGDGGGSESLERQKISSLSHFNDFLKLKGFPTFTLGDKIVPLKDAGKINEDLFKQFATFLTEVALVKNGPNAGKPLPLGSGLGIFSVIKNLLLKADPHNFIWTKGAGEWYAETRQALVKHFFTRQIKAGEPVSKKFRPVGRKQMKKISQFFFERRRDKWP